MLLEGQTARVRRQDPVGQSVVRLAGKSFSFQFLPEEREALTAAALRQRFADLYLQPYGVELDPALVKLVQGGRVLAPEALVGKGTVKLELEADAGPPEKEVLELLRSRIERRFRPDSAK